MTAEIQQKTALPKMNDEKREVFNKILSHFKNNRMGYIKAPTGWGKTFLARHLIKKFYDEGRVVLFLVSGNNPLLNQTAYNENGDSYFQNSVVLKKDHHIVPENLEKRIEHRETGFVIFASLQTLVHRVNVHLRSIVLRLSDLIIIDEIHNFIGNIGNRFVDDIRDEIKVLGMTATPFQGIVGDIKTVEDISPGMNRIYEKSLIQCMKDGQLVGLDYTIIYSGQNPFDVFEMNRPSDLRRKMDLYLDCSTLERVNLVIQRTQLAKKAYDMKVEDKRSKTLVFCSPVRKVVEEVENKNVGIDKVTSFHSKLSANIFNDELDVDQEGRTSLKFPFNNRDDDGQFKYCVYLSSDLDEKEKAEIIEAFKRVDESPYVLCTVGMLVEGFDFPDLENLILLRPTLSMRLFEQQLGRVVRMPNLLKKERGKVFEILDDVNNDAIFDRFGSISAQGLATEKIKMWNPRRRLKKLMLDTGAFEVDIIDFSDEIDIKDISFDEEVGDFVERAVGISGDGISGVPKSWDDMPISVFEPVFCIDKFTKHKDEINFVKGMHIKKYNPVANDHGDDNRKLVSFLSYGFDSIDASWCTLKDAFDNGEIGRDYNLILNPSEFTSQNRNPTFKEAEAWLERWFEGDATSFIEYERSHKSISIHEQVFCDDVDVSEFLKADEDDDQPDEVEVSFGPTKNPELFAKYATKIMDQIYENGSRGERIFRRMHPEYKNVKLSDAGSEYNKFNRAIKYLVDSGAVLKEGERYGVLYNKVDPISEIDIDNLVEYWPLAHFSCDRCEEKSGLLMDSSLLLDFIRRGSPEGVLNLEYDFLEKHKDHDVVIDFGVIRIDIDAYIPSDDYDVDEVKDVDNGKYESLEKELDFTTKELKTAVELISLLREDLQKSKEASHRIDKRVGEETSRSVESGIISDKIGLRIGVVKILSQHEWMDKDVLFRKLNEETDGVDADDFERLIIDLVDCSMIRSMVRRDGSVGYKKLESKVDLDEISSRWNDARIVCRKCNKQTDWKPGELRSIWFLSKLYPVMKTSGREDQLMGLDEEYRFLKDHEGHDVRIDMGVAEVRIEQSEMGWILEKARTIGIYNLKECQKCNLKFMFLLNCPDCGSKDLMMLR